MIPFSARISNFFNVCDWVSNQSWKTVRLFSMLKPGVRSSSSCLRTKEVQSSDNLNGSFRYFLSSSNWTVVRQSASVTFKFLTVLKTAMEGRRLKKLAKVGHRTTSWMLGAAVLNASRTCFHAVLSSSLTSSAVQETRRNSNLGKLCGITWANWRPCSFVAKQGVFSSRCVMFGVKRSSDMTEWKSSNSMFPTGSASRKLTHFENDQISLHMCLPYIAVRDFTEWKVSNESSRMENFVNGKSKYSSWPSIVIRNSVSFSSLSKYRTGWWRWSDCVDKALHFLFANRQERISSGLLMWWRIFCRIWKQELYFIGCELKHPRFWVKTSRVIDSGTGNLSNLTLPNQSNPGARVYHPGYFYSKPWVF